MPKIIHDSPFFVPNASPNRANHDRQAPFSAFHAVGDKVFEGFRFPHDGLLDNLDKLYAMNQKGQIKLIVGSLRMNTAVNAAVDGRLFVRDRENYLRQVSLQKGEKDELDFHVSEPISEPVVPPRPKFYFIKNLLGKLFSYFNAMVEDYNNWKNFDKAITDFANEYNAGKGPKDSSRFKFAPAKAAPIVPEQPVANEVQVNEVQVNEVQENKIEVNQPVVESVPIEPQLSAEELLNMDPMNMTSAQFEAYLDVLHDRNVVNDNRESLAMAVINDPDSTPDDYYEAVTQELQGVAAKKLLDRLSTATDKIKEDIIEQQKPIFSSMARGLKAFVWNYPGRTNKEVVNEYFKVRALQDINTKEAREYKDKYNLFTLKMNMMADLMQLQFEGVSDYLDAVKQQGANIKQAQQQAQQQIQMQQQIQVQQPDTKPVQQGLDGPG